jgi:4-alpha-glucanotransferase
MTSLEELAERCGIQSTVPNIQGDDEPVKDGSRQQILKAMGIEAGDEASAASSLSRLEEERWSRALPYVSVIYQNKGPATVSLVLPQGTQEFTWTLILEDGSESSQTSDFSQLEMLGTHPAQDGTLECRRLVLPETISPGYHRLRLDATQDEMSLIVTPGQCWLPGEPEHAQRLWGVATQVYLLRSQRNWGIGDFTDLRQLAEIAGKQGAEIIGVNPLHAMFLDKPEDASPYSPSDRLLLNVLNIDVEQVPGFKDSEEAQQLFASERFSRELQQCREADLVQYKVVNDLKLDMLKLLYKTFTTEGEAAASSEFQNFRNERRELLERACTFQALRLYFTSSNPELVSPDDWPEEYRSSKAAGVVRFAEEHADLIGFQTWLQWLADRQLKEVKTAAERMTIGLYRDLAVGSHSSGAEVWTNPDLFAATIQVGAPADPGNPAGQNWGLPPLEPHALTRSGYRSFIDLLRTNMRFAGALRIDHAMALRRLYWIPSGGAASDGAYVEYPIEDMVGIIALESQRSKCVVIGEDLGTVPDGFSERMAEANILSYRVLSFEHDDNELIAPHEYPRLALSVAGNHDLPTLPGWWSGSDIDLREKLNLFPQEGAAQQARSSREQERELMLKSFKEQQLIPDDEIGPDQFSEAAHRFLGRTKSLLTLVQLDDLMREGEQVNVPGTSDENPNWRRKLSMSLRQLEASGRLTKLAADMNKPAKA